MTGQPTAVILLADVDQAAQVALRLASEKIFAEVATGSDDLYRLVYHRTADLVIIDANVPGFLSGIEILERLCSDALLRPVTILVADGPAEWDARARKSGVSRVLSKRDGLESLVTTAKSLIALSPGSRLNVVPQAKQVARQFDAIIFPQLARKMFGYLRDENCSTKELAAEIAIDAKATCGLLRITNSAALGLKCKITKLPDAVNLLGPRRAASYVLRALLVGSHDIPTRKIDKDLVQWFRRRALATACVASTFAAHLPGLDADAVYVYGLLQDVGILAMAQAYGRRYWRLFEKMQRPGSGRLELLEDLEFELNHAHVSGAVLEKWGLPESFVSLALSHHSPSTSPNTSQQDDRTLQLMRLGEAAANMLVHPKRQPSPHLNQLLREHNYGTTEECFNWMIEALNKMWEGFRLFSIDGPNRAQMAKLIEQQFNIQSFGAAPTRSSDADATPISIGSEVPIQTRAEDPLTDDAKILVVDDECQFLRLVESCLMPVGLKMLSARSVDEAVRLAPGARAILCDVHLGTEDGKDVVRQLKQSNCRAPLIMVSADCARRTIEDCLALAIDDYLIKPFSPLALLTKIEKHTGLVLRHPATKRVISESNTVQTRYSPDFTSRRASNAEA